PDCISPPPRRTRSRRRPRPRRTTGGIPMNKRFAIPLGLLLALSFAATSAAQDAADPAALARQLLDHLDAGRYDDAEAMFTPDMAAAVPADKLEAVWKSIPAQAGAAKGRGETAVAAQSGTPLATVPLHYEKADLVALVAIDGGKVSGFVI